MFPLLHPLNIILETLGNEKRQETKIKSMHIGKEKNKTVFVHRWHDSLCKKSRKINNNFETTLELRIKSRLKHTRLIYKSQLLPYIPAKNKWNLKLRTQYHFH